MVARVFCFARALFGSWGIVKVLWVVARTLLCALLKSSDVAKVRFGWLLGCS